MSNLFQKLETKARKRKRTIILPESYDGRVIKATKEILKRKIANVILIRTNKNIPVKDDNNLTIIDVRFSEQFTVEYKFLTQQKKQKSSRTKSETNLRDPLRFACMLLRNKYADAVVAGSVYSTAEVLRNGIRMIGLKHNNKTVSSFFLFTFPPKHKLKNKVFSFADCGVVPNPDYKQLSDIAIETSQNFAKLTGIKPRTAFLSFSTKGSAKDESTEKVLKAFKLTKQRAPKLICDGELQFDAAFVPQVARRKNPNGKIKGDANVFIFPDLNSANIAYKITERIGGAIATGPIVQGLAKPVMDLSRGCSAEDIVNMVKVVCNLC